MRNFLILLLNLCLIRFFLEPRVVKATSLLEFFDSGRNLLIAGDIDMTKPYRFLFNNLGVEVDEIVLIYKEQQGNCNNIFRDQLLWIIIIMPTVLITPSSRQKMY